MDSGNSGSLQSSSGGDDEYDSRTESISAFLNSSTMGGALTNPQLPQPSSSHHHLHPHHQNPNHPTSLFDPLSNYFDVFSRSAPPPNHNSPLNLDTVWSRSLRSEPNSNPTDVTALMGSSSSTQPTTILPQSSTMSLPQGIDSPLRPSASSSDQPNVGRQSKKRSRASRRAPTTVLTTDTSNFRAMVQEFTGIPAPPFSASPFPRSRLDLFNTTSSSSIRSDQIRPPPYLLRPFPHKVQQPPPFLSPSTASNTNMNTTSNSTSTNNYQLLSELGLSKQLNMQNPLLTFQSLLQSTIPQKYPVSNPSGHASYQENSNSQHVLSANIRMGALEDFNVNQVTSPQLNELPNFLTSEGMLMRNHNLNCGGSRDEANDVNQEHLRENYGNSTCKMNYAGGGSLSQEKVSEHNVTSRGGGGGEGMVDSWICSSD